MPIIFFHPCDKLTLEAVQYVENKVRERDSTWAWYYMTAAGGIDRYPNCIVHMVERQEQRELEQQELEAAA